MPEQETETPKRTRRPAAPTQIDFVFERMQALRLHAQRFVRALEEHIPDCDERAVAIELVQGVLMRAAMAPPRAPEASDA